MESKLAYVPFLSLFDWCVSSKIGSRQGKKQGKYKLYISSATEIKRYDDYLEDGDSLVFGTGGNPSIHLASGKFAYTNHTECAKSRDKNINLKYYYYYFQMNNFLLLRSTFVGGGIKNSSKKKIGALLVPKLPLEEQNRIVKQIEEHLSQLDSAVETLNKTKQQLEIYRQAVLKEEFDIFTEEHESVSDLCSSIVDCPHSTPKWTKEGKICLRTTNFKRGYLDLTEKNYVSQDTFENRNKRLVPLPGDIVYSREGAILGIACIIPNNTYVCLGQRMMLLRTSDSLCNRFLMHYLNSPKVNTHIKKLTGGSASPHVNVKDIKALQIPLIPVLQQEHIAKTIDLKFSFCESVEKTINHSLQQADLLRQSILKQVFGGAV